MKNIYSILPLFLISIISCAPKNNRGMKIGIINMKKIYENSTWGKKQSLNINKEIAKREKKLETQCSNPLKKSIVKLNKLNKKTPKNPQAIREHKTRHIGLLRKCNRIRTIFQKEIDKVSENHGAAILKKVKEMASLLAGPKKIDLILTKFRGVVIYMSDSIDITDHVIKLLDSEVVVDEPEKVETKKVKSNKVK
jgi:Skp family chaperone for outer membrane proteins